MAEFSKRAAERIINGIRRGEQLPVNPDAHRPQLTRFTNAKKTRQGYLKTDLSAPTDPLGPPSSANVREMERNPSDNTLSEARETLVYNYDMDLDAEEGVYVEYTKINGLLQFIWVGCTPRYVVLMDEDGEDLLDQNGKPLLE